MTQIILFDAYGTLLDVHSAVKTLSPRLGEKAEAVSQLWRAKQLEYTWVRTLMKAKWQDFEQLTLQALDYALHFHEVKDTNLRDDLMALYFKLEPFPDVLPALTRLKAQNITLGVLSNGSRNMLSQGLLHGGLSPLLTRVFSADCVEKYKTHRKTYQMATQYFDCKPKHIRFVSSNRWDVAAASQFGFKTIWLNRAQNPPEYQDLPALSSHPSLNDIEA